MNIEKNEELELTKDVYKMHIKGFEGLDFKVINTEKYQIAYNPNISDGFCNFISKFDVKDKEEFNKIISEADIEFGRLNKTTTVYLTPFMENLYSNKEKYFEADKFDLVSTEVWQIYKDFSKLENINTNCNLNVSLELTNNMEEYGNCVMSCYQTDDEEDPYGDLDDGYRQAYINYKKVHNDINCDFYFIKVGDEIVGTTQGVYNEKLYGVYSLAIKKEYRGKGIGKEVLKQQLQICKEKNIEQAYIQTELGFYPHKMYKKLGFEDLCVVYYYQKKAKQNA